MIDDAPFASAAPATRLTTVLNRGIRNTSSDGRVLSFRNRSTVGPTSRSPARSEGVTNSGACQKVD